MQARITTTTFNKQRSHTIALHLTAISQAGVVAEKDIKAPKSEVTGPGSPSQ